MNVAAIELWALRVAAVLALLAGMYVKGCVDGTTKQKEVAAVREALRTTEETKQSAKNQLESTNRQNDVLVAEAVAGQAQMDLANYRKSHSMRGALSGCVLDKPVANQSNSCQGAGDSTAIAACKAARLLQSPGTTDRDAGEQLDDLLAEADSINDSYGICLATRPGVAKETLPREAH